MANNLTLLGVGGPPTAAAATLLLDAIGTGASAAWSLRKLRSAYAGSAIKIRRPSDSTTQDIGFSGEDFDAASAISFCGAGDGFIDTWYDQSGNARNLTQATAGNQPKIISAGALITTFSAKGSISFDATNDFLSGAAISNYITAAAYTHLTAGRATAGTNGGTPYNEKCFFVDNAGGYFCCATNSASGVQFYHYDGAVKTASVAQSYPFSAVILGKYDGTNIKGYVGGGSGASVAAGSVQVVTNTLYSGSGNAGATLDGFMGEQVFFNSALSASDCNILANNSATYWGQSWSDIS